VEVGNILQLVTPDPSLCLIMNLFFSAGEPSGDLHAASLMHALREQSGDIEFCGFGGSHMQSAGCCPLLFPLADYPVMGLLPVAVQLGRFLRLASEADRFFRHRRPDAVVLVDNPGFNWWIARRAKFHGIPVFYFLPPQIWAWATWRASKMRRFVDHVMCSMPFEADWYHQRGIQATFTGHPYFDELRNHQFDSHFLAEYASQPDAPVIGVLPGSRTAEVKLNLPMYLRAAERIAQAYPKARFPVAFLRQQHVEMMRQYLSNTPIDARPYVGRTGEIIRSSNVCMSKSGSVSLELLYHTKPSTILYQVSRADFAIYRVLRGTGLMVAPYITLVNILAGSELFPEFISCHDISETLSQSVLRWLDDPQAHANTVAALTHLKSRVAQPGATHRTAQYIMNVLGASAAKRRAA
jgi:lipid-A-disaccharide synthase